MSATPYDDMLDLPHHVSRRHPPMPMRERAAQFAPFSALVGYRQALDETRQEKEAHDNPDDREELEEQDGRA